MRIIAQNFASHDFAQAISFVQFFDMCSFVDHVQFSLAQNVVNLAAKVQR